MAELTYREAVAAGIAQEMRRDTRLVMLGEDIAASGEYSRPRWGCRESISRTRR